MVASRAAPSCGRRGYLAFVVGLNMLTLWDELGSPCGAPPWGYPPARAAWRSPLTRTTSHARPADSSPRIRIAERSSSHGRSP